MRLKSAAVAAVAALSWGSAAGQDEPTALDRISAYMSELTSAQASFRQINADGSESTGTFYLQRPWNARLDYDPPEPALLIASGRTVAIFDRKSNSGPEMYPVKGTPIYFILADEVDLSDSEYLIRHIAGDDFTEVHLRSLRKKFKGYIKLVFSNEPLTLRGWIFVDEFDNSTTFALGPLDRDADIPDELFSINAEKKRHENRSS